MNGYNLAQLGNEQVGDSASKAHSDKPTNKKWH